MPHALFYGAGSNQLRRTDKAENTYEDRFSYADQDMLDMLQHTNGLWRNRATALASRIPW